jgi:hypothetical protein
MREENSLQAKNLPASRAVTHTTGIRGNFVVARPEKRLANRTPTGRKNQVPSQTCVRNTVESNTSGAVLDISMPNLQNQLHGAGPGAGRRKMLPRKLVRVLVVGLLMLMAWPVWAGVRITQVQVGFADASGHTRYGRFGHWLPLRITVEADRGETLQAAVWVMTPDADGILNEVQAHPTVHLSPGQSKQTVWAYLPCGHGKLRVELRDGIGRRLASFTYPDDAAGTETWQLLPPQVMQVLTIGEPAGLSRTVGGSDTRGRTGVSDETGRDPGYRVSHIQQPDELPERWFGYDSVQALVIATGGEKGEFWLEVLRKRPQVCQAIRDWTQQGGHLIVTAAQHASRLSASEQFPLADMLPGEVAPGRAVYEEVLVGVRDVAMHRHREASALSALRCTFADFRKKPGAFQRAFGPEREKPAVLVWPYGAGQVTLVAFDTNLPPFTSWEGQTAFWEWLLETEPLPVRQSYRTALTTTLEEDFLTRLLHQLEQSPGAEIPFALVAGLMLAYLLLAGPLDYLILVRWLRRPVLGWLTLPMLVAGISVMAWYSAQAIHGTSLQVYQLDVYDLEVEPASPRSGQAIVSRGSGSSWLVVKSPRLAAFSLALSTTDPESVSPATALENASTNPSAAHLSPASPARGVALREAVLSWAIRPDDEALRRGSRENLVQSAILLQPGQGSIANIPLQTWSLKTLFGRWLFDWHQPPLLAEWQIRAPDLTTLRGQLTWRASWPLHHAELVYGNRVWPLGQLNPGQTVVLRRNDYGLLDRHRFGRSSDDLSPQPGTSTEPGGPAVASQPADGVSPSVQSSPSSQVLDILRHLTFQRLLVVGPNQQPSPYLPFLDQSRRLRYGQAVLLGMIPPCEAPLDQMHQLPGLAASLQRIEPSMRGTLRRSVFVRIYFYPSTGE